MNMIMMMMMMIKTTIIMVTIWKHVGFPFFSITVSFKLRLDDNATHSCEQYNLFVFCERVKNVDSNLKNSDNKLT